MNPIRKGILAILSLIALGVMLFGGMQLGLEVAKHTLQKRAYEQARAKAGEGPSPAPSERPPPWALGHCLLDAIAFLLGLGLLLGSSALARRLAEDWDE